MFHVGQDTWQTHSKGPSMPQLNFSIQSSHLMWYRWNESKNEGHTPLSWMSKNPSREFAFKLRNFLLNYFKTNNSNWNFFVWTSKLIETILSFYAWMIENKKFHARTDKTANSKAEVFEMWRENANRALQNTWKCNSIWLSKLKLEVI